MVQFYSTDIRFMERIEEEVLISPNIVKQNSVSTKSLE